MILLLLVLNVTFGKISWVILNDGRKEEDRYMLPGKQVGKEEHDVPEEHLPKGSPSPSCARKSAL